MGFRNGVSKWELCARAQTWPMNNRGINRSDLGSESDVGAICMRSPRILSREKVPIIYLASSTRVKRLSRSVSIFLFNYKPLFFNYVFFISKFLFFFYFRQFTSLFCDSIVVLGYS